MSNRRLKRRKEQLEKKQAKYFKPTITTENLEYKSSDNRIKRKAYKEVKSQIKVFNADMETHLMYTHFNTYRTIDSGVQEILSNGNLKDMFKYLMERHMSYYLNKKTLIEKGRDLRYKNYDDFLYDCMLTNKSFMFEGHFHFLLNSQTFDNMHAVLKPHLVQLYKAAPECIGKFMRFYKYNIFNEKYKEFAADLDPIDLRGWNLEIKKNPAS